MITDIPTPEDFHQAGTNQLFLGWRIAMEATHDFRGLEEAYGLLDEETTRTFWDSSQPALANAFGLVQQGMELALKARIARVSPFLLISRDPRDWPRRVASEDTSFGEFRSLDAADLIKVHNSLISPRLSDEFVQFWDQVRRDRNKILHSIAPKTYDPATIIRTILTAAETLFDDLSWPARLLRAHDSDRNAATGYDEYTFNVVMQEIDDAISFLSTAEAKRFLGFDKSRRSYLCPRCHYASNRDWQDTWPHLAQLRSKAAGETLLACIVCKTSTVVDREACVELGCKGNVISDGMCLTCTGEQSEALLIASDLPDTTLGPEHEYEFSFSEDKARRIATISLRVTNDEDAKAYAKQALEAKHLAEWQNVTVKQHSGHVMSPEGISERILGNWSRREEQLVWSQNKAADRPKST